MKRSHNSSLARSKLLGERFSQLLRMELESLGSASPNGKLLLQYYRNLFVEDGAAEFPVGISGYVDRLSPAIERIRQVTAADLPRFSGQLPERALVLDAGSGYGTESLLFATLKAEVTSVELVEERHLLARSRLPFYQKHVDFPLLVQWVNSDILRFLAERRQFDFVWAMEAISHIHLFSQFLQLAREALKPSGFLIVSDPNAFNPLSLARSVWVRRSVRHRTHQRFPDPATCAKVNYAIEHIFTVERMRKILEGCGFLIEEISMTGFMGSSFLPRSWKKSRALSHLLQSFQRFCSSAPIVNRMGSIYTIVARKV